MDSFAAALAAEPLAKFEVQERLGLDWARTLLTYQVDFSPARALPGNLRLENGRGEEVPVQLSAVRLHPDGSIARARVSFMAELSHGASWSYRLLAGQAGIGEGPCKVIYGEHGLTLNNGILEVRLPKAGRHQFELPLGWGSNHAEMIRAYGKQVQKGIAPGPIQGVRLADGRWIGGSYFYAEKVQEAPKLKAYTCEVTERGPLFVEARVHYTFDQDRYYQFTARLLAEDPALRIDEQFDLHRTGDSFLWQVVLSLTRGWEEGGWKPDSAFWYSAAPQPARPSGREPELEARLKALGLASLPFQAATFGSGKLDYREPVAKVFDVACWYPWHRNAHYFGLLDSGTLAGASSAPASIPFVGVIPMHAGNWRGATKAFNATLFAHQADDVDLHWPLAAEPHPNTLLHTGEYDPALPFTFGRRQWALVAGPLQWHGSMHKFRQYAGYITLDDYTEWILEWPADAQVTYPRLVFSQADVERIKPTLAQQPGASILQKFLYFNEDDQRRKELENELEVHASPRSQALGGITGGNNMDILGWVSSIGQTGGASWAWQVDELLASSKISEDQRQQLRTSLAALCYVLTEPDFNPRGSMVHLGNPNMPINRFFALAFAAALIPDHPQAQEWLDVSAKYLRYKLAMNEGPNGAWSELITYFHASCPFLMQAAAVLGQAGRLDESTARLAAMPGRFALQLLSPRDPRFGTRVQVGWGHEGCFIYPFWLPAGLVRKSDPALATALMWSWDQLGRPMRAAHDLGFTVRLILNADLLKDLPADYVPAELQSAWLPGFGVVLRAHAGSTNETCLQYRQGYLTSHCDPNQGEFILYSKGAPLTTFSLFGYATYDVEGVPSPYGKLHKSFGWHNRVRFGSQDNIGGWPGGGPISQVHAHFFSPSGDYLRGLGDYEPQRWTRQILFLKGQAATGPNYFVMRDSFHNRQGQSEKLERKWWYLRTAGGQERVAAGERELNYNSPYGAKLNVRFLMPGKIQVQKAEATHVGPLWYQAGVNWRKAGSPVAQERWRNDGNGITVDETMTVSAVGPVAPGQDILAVLYPQGPGEALPRYELLAEGVARIATSEATDYVFVHRAPMTFAQGDASFAGTAGLVRVYGGAVHLVIAEGPGEVSYKGTVLRSPVPAVKVIPISEIGPERLIEIPPPPEVIQFRLDRSAEFKETTPGVKRADFAGGFAYAFASAKPMKFEQGGIEFVGSRGGIVVDEQAGSVKLILVKGERIGYRDLRAWDCAGPYEVTFHQDRITGRTAGVGRFLYLTPPAGLDRLSMLVLDGQTYAPGTAGRTLIVPVLPGEHPFEIRALEQPPIWRNWQAW